MKISKAVWFILILAVWQGVAASGRFSPLIFPSVGMVLKTLYNAVASGELVHETAYSMMLIAEGVMLGMVLSVLLGIAASLSVALRSLVEALITLAHPLPGIALLPVIILWLGTGRKAILFIIVHSVLWPLLLNIMAGFKATPRLYGEVGRNLGAGRAQLFRDIYIPASLPYWLSGLKIAWARAWRALISAEMIFGAAGGRGGLGWYIFKQRVFMDTAGMFAALIVIVLIGVAVEAVCFERLEGATIKKWGMTDA